MPATASKRILVIDAEKDVLEALKYTIEDEGYEVVTATSVADALARTAEEPLHAVLLGVSIDKATSLEIAKELRDIPATASLPIVVISSVDESVVRAKFTDYGLFVSQGADLGGLVKQLELLVGAATTVPTVQQPPAV